MALTVLAPVALLLILLAMERVEARLCPPMSTAHRGEAEVGPQVERPPADDLATTLAIPAQPVAGAVTVPATAQ